MPSDRPLLFAGQDFGKRRDASALVLISVDSRQRTAEVVGIKVWDHMDYKIVIRDTLKLYLKKRWRMLDIDIMPVGELVMEEYVSLGIPAEPMRFSIRSKQKMIVEALLLLLAQGRLRLKGQSPNDVELLKQIREQESIKSPAGYDAYTHPEGTHDDIFWALALAVNAAQNYLFEHKASIFSTLDDRPFMGLYAADSALGRAAKVAQSRWSTFATGTVNETTIGDSPGRWMRTIEDEAEQKEREEREGEGAS